VLNHDQIRSGDEWQRLAHGKPEPIPFLKLKHGGALED
jgi:hypothetical protein